MGVQDENKMQNLPWVEKYRPETLKDLISHEDIISTIERFIEEDHLPHLLFYGPPGTGKTSTILACARKLYSPKEFNSMVLELNASDDRGIGVVREQILSFASTRTIFKSGFKLVILDEADAMTNDAQNALRRVIEKFTENVRFCLICNYLGKIIPAIQSRCTRFRFGPLSSEQILPRLNFVIEQENVNVSEDGRKALLALSGGDMRKVLNILQSTSMAYKEVTEDNVYTCVGHPLRSDITNIINWMLNEQFEVAYKKVTDLKIAKGLALQDILTEVHNCIHRRTPSVRLCRSSSDKEDKRDFMSTSSLGSDDVSLSLDFPMEVRVHLVQQMSDVELRLCAGASEKLQLSAVLAAFTQAKHMVEDQASAK